MFFFSGSRIVCKAMPAVGADGQTIMKTIIPVRTVKENVVLTQKSEPKCNQAPKTENLNFANSTPAQVDPCVRQFVGMQVSLGNVLPNKRNKDHKPPPPKQPHLEKVPQTDTPATHCETSETIPGYCSVTEKSSYKQIQRVPASNLLPINSRHVFTPSANSSPGFCVSPINPVNIDALPHSTPAPPSFKLLPNKTPLSGPKRSLKLIPQTPQRPNSPIRWMVEEDDNLGPPSLQSSGVASEVLWSLGEKGRACKQPEVSNKNLPLLSQNRTGQKEEDALVLCNGEVFGKCCPPLQMGKSDSKSYIFKKVTSPSESTQSRQVYKLIIPRRSHEVRDFCEDAQDEKSQQETSTITPPDEDSVVFMSYTPLPLKSALTHLHLTPEIQETAAVRGTVQIREKNTVTKSPAWVDICCEKPVNMSHSTQQVACMEQSRGTVTSDSDSTCSAADMDAWIKEVRHFCTSLNLNYSVHPLTFHVLQLRFKHLLQA